jgi:hypothetical protein
VASIADELNAARVVTASGRPVSIMVVRQKQGREGLRVRDEQLLARQIIRQGLLDNLPRPDLRRQLQEQAPRLGRWNAQRLSEAICRIRRGAPGIEPLPTVLPAEQEKQCALALIEEGVTAGNAWTKIAAALNTTGLRPPRGKTFTPVQVRLLYLRARGLRSFKLPSSRSDKRPEEK